MRSTLQDQTTRFPLFLTGVRATPGRHPEWLAHPDPRVHEAVAESTDSLDLAGLIALTPGLRYPLSRNPLLAVRGYVVPGLLRASFQNGQWSVVST